MIEVDWSSIDPVLYEVGWGVGSMWIESRSSADRPLIVPYHYGDNSKKDLYPVYVHKDMYK